MNLRKTRHAVVVSTLLCAGVSTLAACSGADSGRPSTEAEAKTDTEGQRAAQQFLDGYLQNPASIGVKAPLGARPPEDKSVIYIKFPTGVSARSDAAQRSAAEALGWGYGSVDAGTTPASAVAAFEAALAQKPDAIIFDAFPAALFTKQIAQAKASGVEVLSKATGDGTVDGVLADLGGAEQEARFAKLTAAFFVSHADEGSQVAAVTFQGFPIAEAFTNAFTEAVEEWCATCTTDVVNQQVTDVGTKTPAQVVTYLRTHPEVKWLVFVSGDIAQGVSAAIKAAGITDVKIIGQSPAEANFAGLESGTDTAWVGLPVDVMGWQAIDVLARRFTGVDISASVDAGLPMQILTAENISTAVATDGYWIGVEDYEDQFRTLWQIG